MTKRPPPVRTQFKPGDPKRGGRTKGTRNALCAGFISDLCEEWYQHGPEILRIVRAEEPSVIMKLIAQLCPKELEIKPNALAELTDEQLDLIAGLLQTRSADDPAGDRGGENPTIQ